MKNRNLIALVLLIMIVAVIAAVVIIGQNESDIDVQGAQQMDLNFFNPIDNNLETESRLIKEGTHAEMLSSVLEELKSISKNTNLVSALPEDVAFMNFSMKSDDNDRNIAEINMSEEYNNMTAKDEIYARFAIVRSVTELEFIDGVHLFVNGKELLRTDGKPLGILYREDMLNNPVISPDKTNRQTIVLYFSDEQAMGLVPEEREIEVKQSQTLEYQIVEQLIAGPSDESLYPTLPEGTKILNISTKDRICYIDLSGEFISKHSGGSTGEYLTVYSIVNTLTDNKNLETVKYVKFTVDGKKVSDFKGHIDLSKTFEHDDAIILSN